MIKFIEIVLESFWTFLGTALLISVAGIMIIGIIEEIKKPCKPQK